MSSIQDMGGGRSPRSTTSASRRSSYGLMNKPPLVESHEPPPPPTPAMVARDFFKRDLAIHEEQDTDQSAENGTNGDALQRLEHGPTAAVILHDACYGHRYSRPRTSKASLSTIVERPERIRAIVLGIATAYVLLGDRHSAGANPPHPKRTTSTLPFLIRKSSRKVPLTTSAVTNVHGSAWMTELQEMCLAAEAKLTSTGKELVRPKGDTATNGEDKPRLHEGDLYLCAESLEAFEGALGGVLDAVDMVFSPTGPRRCFACVRPPGHHCSSDYPSGFCWLNNVHIGISYGASSHGLTYAAIFDFDLHHGDGSQSVTWAHNAKVSSLPKNASLSRKTKIGYFSLHDINSYPCEWGDEDKVRNASLCVENAHGQTIWNVHLQPWETEKDFWRLYAERYSVLLDKMRVFLRAQHQKFLSLGHGSKAKGAIFVSAGFDASEWEGQGMQRHEVNVPTDFYARVTRDIVEMSKEPGLGVDGRVISVLEGGYSDRALASGALSHMCGLTSSTRESERTSVDELANISSQVTSSTTNQSASVNGSTRAISPYQSAWWKKERLDELENVASPKPIAPVARKPRGGPAPTYQTPTQSFTAKVVSPPTYQRSISGSAALRQSSGPSIISRPPTPPPPEVDWTIASQELAQLLIPQDKITTSCKPEDLNVKATEARKTRQSLVGPTSNLQVPVDELQKMQLRDRKAKPLSTSLEEPGPESRAGANRRRTVGGVEVSDAVGTRDLRRRVSVASTILSNSDDSSAGKNNLQLDDLSVAKQRAPPKPRAPKKAVTKPPIPRVPSAFKKETSQEPSKVATPASLPSTEQSMDADLASLASGVKKLSIKLNVPSREEYEARGARKPTATEAKKTTAIKAPRKPAMKKSTKDVPKEAINQAPVPKPETQGQPLFPEVVAPAPEETTKPQIEPTQSPAISNSIPLSSILNDLSTGASSTPPPQQAPPTFQPPDPSYTATTATALMPGVLDFSMNSVDPSALATLSRQARLQSLSRSGLVRTWSSNDDENGLSIIDGEICPNKRGGWSPPFPRHLLSVEGSMGLDAKEVPFSQNRILLGGDMIKSVMFLNSMGDESVKHIRALDIMLNIGLADHWHKGSEVMDKWRQLANFIAIKLELEQLHLTLNAGPTYEMYLEWKALEEDLELVSDAYDEIVEVLVRALGGKKPKSFTVYWAAFHDNEIKAEKRVMGENYDSSKVVGKVPSSRRNPWFPHGAPREDFEWKHGMKLC